jgi:hypothetical protein
MSPECHCKEGWAVEGYEAVGIFTESNEGRQGMIGGEAQLVVDSVEAVFA